MVYRLFSTRIVLVIFITRPILKYVLLIYINCKRCYADNAIKGLVGTDAVRSPTEISKRILCAFGRHVGNTTEIITLCRCMQST